MKIIKYNISIFTTLFYWWKCKCSVSKEDRIRKKFEQQFICGCDSFGDDRVKSFEFYKLIRREEQKEIDKLKL